MVTDRIDRACYPVHVTLLVESDESEEPAFTIQLVFSATGSLFPLRQILAGRLQHKTLAEK